MNKKEFIESFEYDDKTILANLYERIVISNKSGLCIFSNEFYPPSIWKVMNNLQDKLQVKVDTFGIFEDADRRLISFNRYYDEELPVYLVRVNLNNKFENITHKDCLGSLMSLGIKREKFGDLVLDDSKLYFPIVNEVFDYINENLTKIKHTPIVINKLDLFNEMPMKKFEEKIIITSSIRIDAIVSSITGVSRNKAIELIKHNFVKVNYINVTEKDKCVQLEDVITIEKYGKYIINEQISTTHSQRLRIKIKKFT